MCWYCIYGLPKPVADIWQEALNKLPFDEPLLYGPAHVVWSDNNFEDESIKFCLKECDRKGYWNYEPAAIAIVRESLEKLLLIPEEVRVPPGAQAENDDGEPMPPPAGMVMVKKYDWQQLKQA